MKKKSFVIVSTIVVMVICATLMAYATQNYLSENRRAKVLDINQKMADESKRN